MKANWKWTYWLAGAAIVGLFIFVGCTENKNNIAGPLSCPNNGCPGIASSPGVLISAIGGASSSMTQVQMNLDLVGNSQNFDMTDPRAFVNYSGPIGYAGTMTINSLSGVATDICNAPTGGYVVQANTEGIFQSVNFSGGSLVATGPNGVLLYATVLNGNLTNASVDPNGLSKGSPSNRAYMQLRVDSVNNLPCGVPVTLQ